MNASAQNLRPFAARALTICALFFVSLTVCFAQHEVLKQYYDAGETQFAKGGFRDAHGYFAQVATQSSDNDLRSKALYMRALCSYKLKENSTAAHEFDEFVRVYPDHPLVFRAAIYAGNANYFVESYVQAAEDFAFAMLSNDAREQKTARDGLEKILWGYMPLDNFPALLDRVNRSVEGTIGALWLKRLQTNGDYAQAFREGQKLLLRVYDPTEKKRVQDELAKVENYLKQHLVVAVLVPQTGEYAKFGNDVLNGVRLATEQASVRVELKPIDSGGDPLTTAKQIDALLRTCVPLCIIGPVTSNETVAAGAIAGALKFPLITPTASRSGIADLSPYVFQLITNPVNASEFLAEYAVNDTADTFAILAPDDDLGRECAMAFAKVIKAKGKTIVGAQFFKPGTIDFTSHLLKLKEPILVTYDKSVTYADTTDTIFYDLKAGKYVLRHRSEWAVHFDGLFLPCYYADIVNVLPQIPFFYINTQIFGTVGWVASDLRKEQKIRKYLEGATFVPDDFYAVKDNALWGEFARNYKKRFSADPTRVASLGYDAAQLVLSAINKGAVTQELMRDYLSGVHSFAGASGPVSFDERGANSKANVMQISGGEPVLRSTTAAPLSR